MGGAESYHVLCCLVFFLIHANLSGQSHLKDTVEFSNWRPQGLGKSRKFHP